MPKLKTQVKQEYQKLSILRESSKLKEIEKYAVTTSDLVREVASRLMKFCEVHKIPTKDAEEIVEYMKDTAIIEGICAADGDFTNIEDYVLASKNKVFEMYHTMLDPAISYDPEKAIDKIKSPNSGNEEEQDQAEIMRWSRMLVEYMANGTDNENEQLSKGSNKRKSNNQ